METILATLSGIVLSWAFIIAVFLIAVFADYRESKNDDFGWPAFYTVVAVTCACLLTKPSLFAVAVVAVAWIPVGLIWAVTKWKLRISKTKYEIERHNLVKGTSQYELLKDRLDIDKVKSTVAYWVLFWPISLLSTCLFNVFESIEYLVTVKLGGKFRKMAEEAFK